jgi:hypothetical protein
MVADPDAEASAIYRLAGADLYNPPGGAQLARMLLGDDAIRVTPGMYREAEYSGAHRAILVRRGLCVVDLNFLICHEAVEWYCDFIEYQEPNREWFCNAVAARLVAPREAVRAALRVTPGKPANLATWFCVSQTVAALRIGEVTGRPLALVTPEWITVRGDEFAWPEEPVLRRFATGELEAPELEREELTDAPRRVVLTAA